MHGDGDGWFVSSTGSRHWGRFGAAGLLLIAPNQQHETTVLLQYRAAWTAHGLTWALPGGARDSHETATDAALREAAEECGLDPGEIEVHEEIVTATLTGADGGRWTYTTVLAVAPTQLDTVPNQESLELRWCAPDEVRGLELVPAFAQAWPQLQARIAAMPPLPSVDQRPQ